MVYGHYGHLLYRDGIRKIIKVTSRQIQLLGEIHGIGGADACQRKYLRLPVMLLFSLISSTPVKYQVFNHNMISSTAECNCHLLELDVSVFMIHVQSLLASATYSQSLVSSTLLVQLVHFGCQDALTW